MYSKFHSILLFNPTRSFSGGYVSNFVFSGLRGRPENANKTNWQATKNEDDFGLLLTNIVQL